MDVGTTTGVGGIVGLAVVLFVKDWIQGRKTEKHENTKIGELSSQTVLLQQLVDHQKDGKKRSKREHRRTQKLLRQMSETCETCFKKTNKQPTESK